MAGGESEGSPPAGPMAGLDVDECGGELGRREEDTVAEAGCCAVATADGCSLGLGEEEWVDEAPSVLRT